MKDNLYLRKATMEDMDMIFAWANDPIVRQNAFCMELIPYENHVVWYKKIMESPDVLQYILMNHEVPVGQIRLNVEPDQSAEIDYSIVKEYRGKGYGKQICDLLIKQIAKENISVKTLIARVKPENHASSACFENNKFEKKFIQYEYTL